MASCPPPFLSLTDFPYKGGLEISRLCKEILPGMSCCLPCPVTDWIYPSNFNRLNSVANWLNIAGLVCCAILLLSFACLPVQKTSRHYLTICLIVGVGLLSARSVVTLATKPTFCYDGITANDMYSDIPCAVTGSLVIVGGFSAVMWVFIRSLSLHLQICWQIVPGRKFFLLSLLAGWGLPLVSLAMSLVFTGVSYRFGDTCLLNHANNLATFWVPLLVITGLAVILQFVTFAYCVRVYIRSLLNTAAETENSSNMASFEGSVRTVTARAAYRRVRKVIALQWRGITIVLIILVDVVFFAIVYLIFDGNTTPEAVAANPNTANWLACLATQAGNKSACLDLAAPLVVGETSVIAVLYLLAVNGIWCLLFLGRLSMIGAWWDIAKGPFVSRDHFVSVDARRLSDPRNYEMLSSLSQKMNEDLGKSPTMDSHLQRDFGSLSPTSPTEGFYGQEASYRSPTQSFSHPRPPTRAVSEAGRASSQPPGRERYTPPGEPDRTLSLRDRGRDGSAGPDRAGPGADGGRAASALGRERAGSALGRNWDPRAPHARPGVSPPPRRANSALGHNWDPRTTYARAGALSPDRGDSALGFTWNAEPVHVRGSPTPR